MLRRKILLHVLLAAVIRSSSAFVLTRSSSRSSLASRWPATPPSRASSSTLIQLFWFGKDGDSNKKDGTSDNKRKGTPGLGGVAQVMDSMDSFKKAQQVGKLTGELVQSLASIVVEGTAADGKVRVFFDGQQYPKRVQVDETYVSTIDVDDLNSALTAAMQDAYAKSREKMEEKTKDLYGELGLPSSAS